MRIKKYRKDYRFKALKFDRRRGILYLHFILSCLLSERRKHCKDSRKKIFFYKEEGGREEKKNNKKKKKKFL